MAPIPLTLIGIIPGHWLLNAEFTATSMIGFIALAGIIVRNSILLVDFSIHQVNSGVDIKDAVVLACKTRTRPILITAFALVGGSSVIITDPIFQGMAISLLFGVLISTLLTLVIIPLGCISARSVFCPATVCENGSGGTAEPVADEPKTSLAFKVWTALITVIFFIKEFVVVVYRYASLIVSLLAGMLPRKKTPQFEANLTTDTAAKAAAVYKPESSVEVSVEETSEKVTRGEIEPEVISESKETEQASSEDNVKKSVKKKSVRKSIKKKVAKKSARKIVSKKAVKKTAVKKEVIKKKVAAKKSTPKKQVAPKKVAVKKKTAVAKKATTRKRVVAAKKAVVSKKTVKTKVSTRKAFDKSSNISPAAKKKGSTIKRGNRRGIRLKPELGVTPSED